MSAPGDLSVTALYTSRAWAFGEFEGAELFATDQAKGVFDATNGALALARLGKRGAPKLAESLVQRHAMIDHLVRRSGATRLLELAAGLSARGARLSADPAFEVVEVDLPHVVRRKRALLAGTAEGQEVFARPNLSLVAGDARRVDLDALVPGSDPVFVTAEGLLMYLDAKQQWDFVGRIADLCAARPGSAFAFDLVPHVEEPPPGPLGRVLESLMKGATGGRGFERDERTRDAIAGELYAAGFRTVELFEPAAPPSGCELPFPDEPTQQLVFHGRDAEAVE